MTMIQDRLDGLLSICMEYYAVVYNINVHEVIDTFNNFTLANRRMEL